MAKTAVGYRVRERRKQLGLTQRALAHRLGISASYLNLIEANKRTASGRLANDLAGALGVDVDTLTGAAEQRLRDDLRELRTEPVLDHIELEPDCADEIVARNPNWARMILALYRAYLDSNQALALMNDRLGQDPSLQAALHRMLTHITTIRSSAEILVGGDGPAPEQRARFQHVLHDESTRLTDAAQELASFFEHRNTLDPSVAAAEQVDELIIARRNHFPELEEVGGRLRGELDALDGASVGRALVAYLERGFGIRIGTLGAGEFRGPPLRDQSLFDADGRSLRFPANAPVTTRRFQMARTAAELAYGDALAAAVDDPRLTSDAARRRAVSALSSYVAGATLFPYAPFLEDAERYRYDIELLRQRYDAGYEQACHRLVTLRAPDAEGVPFAFLRVDPSGYISKRFPLFGLSLPRFGHACPLWPVFRAFQTPGRVVRELVEPTPGSRFMMIARTVTKRPATFRAQPVMFSVMLACDELHADRTVYAEGIALGAEGVARPVGSTCRQCERLDCQHRQEAPATSRV